MNWRGIPHPSYGNYGGAHKSGGNYLKAPIDEMDLSFRHHDLSLYEAGSDKRLIYLADSTLFLDLTMICPLRLVHPIYGTFYWTACLLIFGIVHYFFKPRINKI